MYCESHTVMSNNFFSYFSSFGGQPPGHQFQTPVKASPLLWELQRCCCSSEMFSALPVSQGPDHQKPELYFPCEAPITSLLGFAPLGFCYYKILTESPSIDSKASEDHGLPLLEGCYLPKDFKLGSILEVVYLGPRQYQRTHNV